MMKNKFYTQLKNAGKFERDWGTHSETMDIKSTVLLQQEINSKLAAWSNKQAEVVSKLATLQKKERVF